MKAHPILPKHFHWRAHPLFRGALQNIKDQWKHMPAAKAELYVGHVRVSVIYGTVVDGTTWFGAGPHSYEVLFGDEEPDRFILFESAIRYINDMRITKGL